jgi:hypothetical protein
MRLKQLGAASERRVAPLLVLAAARIRAERRLSLASTVQVLFAMDHTDFSTQRAQR